MQGVLMRRIATVALATGVALGGLGVVATTADAATTTRSWVTDNGWSTVKAGGTYKRTSTTVSTSGWLQDTKNNGWSPVVQFKATEGGKTSYSSLYFLTYNGSRPTSRSSTPMATSSLRTTRLTCTCVRPR
jgi:hypothetical protein